jgi:hypothetical protein
MSELSSVAESERQLALERFRILRPHLEHGIALTVIAADPKTSPRRSKVWASFIRYCSIHKARIGGSGTSNPGRRFT